MASAAASSSSSMDALERHARRSSSVSSEALAGRAQSRRSSAASRFAHFRSRAVGSADEKRVTFRATPSVRYFKSTHTASFAENEDDDEQQDPQFRAMRARRVRRQLRSDAVNAVDVQDREKLVLKIAENARQTMENAVRELLQRKEVAKNEWKKRPGARNGTDSETWERRDSRAHHIVTFVTLPCRARELLRVLETSTGDELEAALLACVDERIDAGSLVEKAEIAQREIPPMHAEPRSSKGRLQVIAKRVALPRTKFAGAWKRVRGNDGTADASGSEEIEVIDCAVSTSTRTSRVFQQMATTSSADHALLGSMQVGYVVLDDASASESVKVALFLARKKKPTKGFVWASETLSDALVARLPGVSSVMWDYIERRRLGFQVLAYPDMVFCVDDIQEAQSDVSHCPVCDGEFGFLRKRHFCHLCALWVCAKCSSDKEVEASSDGWLVEGVKVCSACQKRVEECVFDYDAGPAVPGLAVVVNEPEVVLTRRARSLAQHWMQLLQQATTDRDRRACSLVVNTLMGLLAPEEDHRFRLSGLQDDWEDLDADEMHETLEELAEMLPVPFVEPHNCLLSHDAIRRQYVLLFEDDCKYPQSPVTVDDADRVRRVEKLGLVQLAPYQSLETICALAAAELQCAMAFISVVTTDRIILIAKHGTELVDRARDDGFDAYTMQSIHPLVVLDLSRDMRSRHFSITTQERGRFYCGSPLLSPDESSVMASFAVVDTKPRKALVTSEYSLFTAFAWAARSILVRELANREVIPASGA